MLARSRRPVYPHHRGDSFGAMHGRRREQGDSRAFLALRNPGGNGPRPRRGHRSDHPPARVLSLEGEKHRGMRADRACRFRRNHPQRHRRLADASRRRPQNRQRRHVPGISQSAGHRRRHARVSHSAQARIRNAQRRYTAEDRGQALENLPAARLAVHQSPVGAFRARVLQRTQPEMRNVPD